MIILYRHLKKKREEKKASSPQGASSVQPIKKPSEKPPCEHQLRSLSSPDGVAYSRQTEVAGEPFYTSGAGDLQPAQPNVVVGGKCVECKGEKKARRIYRAKIITGLIFPFALQALDVTIIASALPWIASDFREVSQLNWVISAFNLTSAAFIPFWGQMADIFGRHNTLQVCIIIMMIGSAICTGAPTSRWPVLLLGRGFQGMGCAGINISVRIILADKVTLKENAKNWSIFAFTAGMSYGIGPVIGGYLTASNWRWCFGINLPICLAAVILIFFVLRKELLGPQPLATLDEASDAGHLARFSQRVMTIDVGGQFLFLFGFGLVILALTWAGATYGWATVQVLTPLCIGIVLIAAFIAYEYLMVSGRVLARHLPHQKSMLPWELITNKDLGLLFYVNFATGAAMYSVLYFVNIYFTVVKLYTASQAGVQLLYYTPGIGVGVYLAMFMSNVFPRRTFWSLFLGSTIEAVGIGVLAWALWSEHTPTIYGMMALSGAGTGLRLMPGSLHAIGFFPNHIATVVALMSVAVPFGGTVALTIMSTVFNNTSGIAKNASNGNFGSLADLPPALLAEVRNDARMAIVWSFVAITPLMLMSMLAAMGLGSVYITQDKKDEREGYGDNVVHEPYLLHLLRRRHGVNKLGSSSGNADTEMTAVRSSGARGGFGSA